MDIEKIRLETVDLLKSQVVRNGEESDYGAAMIDTIINVSSKVSRTMLQKYHEELNNSK